MATIKFPKNFLIGGAVSAEQSEGRVNVKKGKTIYDLHFAKYPEDFYHQQDASVTCDTINHYQEDIKFMKQAGFNSFRTSLSWARLFPNGMDRGPNWKAVRWYHDYIDQCHNANIEFILTLFHFDLPAFEADKGGWLSEEVTDDFAKYADFVFAQFAHKVKLIVTMNEPQRPAINGYLTGRHWPLEKGNFSKFWQANMGIILAHSKAINIFREKYQNSGAKIGCVFDARRTYPLSDNMEDKKAARISELLFYYGMVDPMTSGWFDPEVTKLIKKMKWQSSFETEKNLNLIKKNHLDFIGVNFYCPLRARKPLKNHQNHIYQNYWEFDIPKNARMNPHRGLEIFPEALGDVMKDIYQRHHLPMWVSENGIGIEETQKALRDPKTSMINDDYRIAFIKEHLEVVRKVMDEQIPVFGYHLWASIDNWSWINGFKNRYGLIEVDLETKQRRIKKSGQWMAQFAKTMSFSSDYQKVDQVINLDMLKHSESK